jgi:hypothetical protein
MRKLVIICLVLLLALGCLGASYASWTQALTATNASVTLGSWIAEVQGPYTGSTTSSGNNTVSASWTKATKTGDLLIAIFSYDNSGDTISPPSGVGWTSAISSVNPGHVTTTIYYILNAVSQSGSYTWTSNNIRHMTIVLLEYSGVATSSALDKTAIANGNNTSLSTGTTTTTGQAYELAIGAMATNGNTTFNSLSGGWAEIGSVSSITGYITSVPIYKILSATGTQNATASIISQPWVGAIATFK